MTLWLTGLSASGKTTVGDATAELLRAQGIACFRLDGDVLRRGLCSDLGFSAEDRHENIRRAAHAAMMLAMSGSIVVASLITPYATDRALARQVHESADLGFLEVFLDTPLAECERRDPRGLYAKARRGDLPGFTGVDDVYEVPAAPDVHLYPAATSVHECASGLLAAVVDRGAGRTPRASRRKTVM
jgi:bifunctional enzyme CysN/CysC